MFEQTVESLRAKNGGSLPFESTFAAIRQKLDDVLENKRMGGDILFMTTYMAAITTAQVSRPEIFSKTSTRIEYVSSKYVEKVEFFVKKWNYSYAQALRLVAERCRNAILRSMLNRYANAIDSGVPDDEFLTLELSTVRSVYRNTFEQGFEMLKKWGDAYIAMMLSGTIVGIIIMVSVAIFAPDDIDATLNMSYAIILMISVFGITTMYRAIPEDTKTHGLPGQGSHEQMMVRSLERVIVPVALVSAVLLALAGINAGLIAIFVGVLLAPLGIIALKDDVNIQRRDEDFTVFLRGLGSIMGGKGLTTTYALTEVDRKSLEVLGSFIDAAYSKLNLGLNEALVWERFIRDSGSNLIYKYLNIFRDSIALGGSPADIGKIVSSSMLEMVLLRKKREMLTTSFIVLLIPMHVAMVAIFAFLYHILLTMSRAVQEVMAAFGETSGGALSGGSGSVGGTMADSMNIFVNFPEDKMGMYLIITLFMITGANILAGKVVKGGDRSMLYFFGSILFALTGIVYIVTPMIVESYFQIPAYGGI
ncbi:MAG TPA: archaellar assembly protein FlaJ [Methanoculleus sp.]|nr:archaellar assembly protein FlaJ [Methanoculleus sp.]